MSRTQAFILTCCLLTAWIPLTATCEALHSRKPNIILIVTDDQGYNDVGFNGSSEIQTPHIDRIANEGVRFTQGYVTGAVCGPSRAGLLTGRYQSRFGFAWNPPLNPEDPDAGLPLEETMISEYLKGAGYRNMIIGKWHMGTHPDLRPAKRGFDEFYGFLSGGHNYMPEDIYLDDISQSKKVGDWYHARLRLNDGYHDLTQYLTDELSDRAVDFVSRHRDEPFFLYLAYNAPHVPLQATEKYLSRFTHIESKDRRTYAAMISAVDDGVGRLLDTLEQQGTADNTLVIFLSDNGGRLPKKPGDIEAASNSPLRGGKGELLEGGIRVPFAMRWPGVIPTGIHYDRAVISLDILATITTRLGIATQPGRPLDGTDLIPFINGESSGEPHDALFWRHLNRGDLAVVSGENKLLSTGASLQFYDLETDVSESRNIIDEESGASEALHAAHRAWNSEMATEGAFGTRTSWPPKNKKQALRGKQ